MNCFSIRIQFSNGCATDRRQPIVTSGKLLQTPIQSFKPARKTFAINIQSFKRVGKTFECAGQSGGRT
jgi:hypothetical protein